MTRLPWLVGGGAALAYFWSRGRMARQLSAATSHAPTSELPVAPPTPEPPVPQPGPKPSPATTAQVFDGSWIFPVAKWGDRRPSISDGVGTPRPGGRQHRGIDIMFVRRSNDPYRPGTSNGSAGHVMPDDVAVLAASDGVVWSAGPTPRGFAVVIDHGPRKVATFYAHLEKLFVKPTERAGSQQRVRAGEPIGIVGFDPLDGEKLKHLHFEVWLGGPKDAIDPARVVSKWSVVDDPRKRVS